MKEAIAGCGRAPAAAAPRRRRAARPARRRGRAARRRRSRARATPAPMFSGMYFSPVPKCRCSKRTPSSAATSRKRRSAADRRRVQRRRDRQQDAAAERAREAACLAAGHVTALGRARAAGSRAAVARSGRSPRRSCTAPGRARSRGWRDGRRAPGRLAAGLVEDGSQQLACVAASEWDPDALEREPFRHLSPGSRQRRRRGEDARVGRQAKERQQRSQGSPTLGDSLSCRSSQARAGLVLSRTRE